jgi:hypothetical protein
MDAVLTEHFQNENLFKRSSYAAGFPAGVPTPNASLAPHLSMLLRSDACPEITVKTILAGQLLQAATIWEMMAFEYIAKRAFDSLCDMMATIGELQTETVYMGPAGDVTAFEADTAIERAAEQLTAANAA